MNFFSTFYALYHGSSSFSKKWAEVIRSCAEVFDDVLQSFRPRLNHTCPPLHQAVSRAAVWIEAIRKVTNWALQRFLGLRRGLILAPLL